VSEARADVLDQPLLAAEQMRDSAHIEPQRVGAVDLDQRRPAACPLGEPLKQIRVAGGVCRDRNQAGVERPGIG
jgi:hypothetical protein